jgi:two-component system CheB/CheR fusion protein
MPPRKRTTVRKKAVGSTPPGESASSPRLEEASSFPIVAIGTGRGLAPLGDLLETFAEEPGLAFVIVQQEEETRATVLPQMLARATSLPVQVAMDGQKLHVNTVYVVPRREQATVSGGMFRMATGSDTPSMPLDALLESLAAEQGSRAVCVILSGPASDGARGSKAIKEEGGITFAQSEAGSGETGSDVNSMAEYVLQPAGIGKELRRIAQRTSALHPRGKASRLQEGDLVRLFHLLYEARDVDFTHYKPATIERRIRRRMSAVKAPSIADYVRLLASSPEEIDALYGDILIRVTSFFRDPAVFESLTREIIPALLRERRDDTPIRIWVPGCSTGEEAYSLAIAFLEAASDSYNCPVQIFGTDVSEAAIDRARAGVYPPTIAEDVSPERLRRFFTRREDGYRVNRSVRESCVFARQNLTKDPPFSRLDLISCRNVLIYLGPVLQRRVMQIFHYALHDAGYLLLGSSETIGNFRDLFRPTDRKTRVYQRTASQRRTVPYITDGQPWLRRERTRMAQEHVGFSDLFREADNVLLSRLSPAGVLINEQMEILQFRGRTSPFLELAPGAASLNLVKMARHGLLGDLRIAIHGARKSGAPARREGIQIRGEGNQPVNVSVEVLPFVNPAREQYFVVLFQEQPPAVTEAKGRKKAGAVTPPPTRTAERLKQELAATREYLQSIIEEQETMNAELRSASEESQSNNEELQSTNEELETAKEELQSSNEELTTLNDELENRNEQLNEANNDLQNILTSVDFPVVMLDSALRIRRFNPGAQRILSLGQADIGHSVRDLNLSLQLDHLDEKITGVIERLEICEIEVQDRAGHWYLLRIRPYKTMDNTIEGAVLVLIDIGRVKSSG